MARGRDAQTIFKGSGCHQAAPRGRSMTIADSLERHFHYSGETDQRCQPLRNVTICLSQWDDRETGLSMPPIVWTVREANMRVFRDLDVLRGLARYSPRWS